MKLEILDSKDIGHRQWYLCKGNLLEYLESLKIDFYDYAIQRKIVKNQYLDKLYTSVKSGDPIPTITLTYEKGKLDNIVGSQAEIDLNASEILDGLQRSFRLWTYLRLANEYKKDSNLDYRDFAKKIKKQNQLFFDSGVVSTKLIKELIDTTEINNIRTVYLQYNVYFTIWTGLTEKEVIQKMLVLNAGQKSVSKTHQFELLFLHFFDTIRKSGIKVELFREKDSEANDIKRGKRDIGQFMFTSIIVALQSFVEGKPLRVSTEKLIEYEFEELDETSESDYDLVFNTKYILHYLTRLVELDEAISQTEDKGIEWFSKDTTLSGVFAAIGTKINFSKISSDTDLLEKTDQIFEILIREIKKHSFNLIEFTNEYNVLSSRSVNIGTFIRKVVMEYTLSLIEGGSPQWNEIFSKVKDKR